MITTSTTYRHDYLPPLTGYKLLKAIQNQQAHECELFCKTQQNISKKDQSARKDSEWTRIGRMGALIEPRVVPFEPTFDNINLSIENITKGKCTDIHNTKFLQMVRKCYPHIYERWYNWPKYKRQIDIDRNKSIYQLDYRPFNKISNNSHIEPEPDDQKYKNIENIMEETIPSECREHYKRFNINLVDSSQIGRCKDNYGPYLFDPESIKISEYMATISRTGCIISSNNIHNHSKPCKTSYVHIN